MILPASLAGSGSEDEGPDPERRQRGPVGSLEHHGVLTNRHPRPEVGQRNRGPAEHRHDRQSMCPSAAWTMVPGTASTPLEYPLALNELSFLLPHFLKEGRASSMAEEMMAGAARGPQG